jgi:hypothetical protein
VTLWLSRQKKRQSEVEKFDGLYLRDQVVAKEQERDPWTLEVKKKSNREA